MSTESLLQLTGVTQEYGGLRPLRIKALDLRAGQAMALMGLDKAAAEVFVNLVTGATVPRTGDVRAFGRLTTDITDSDTWLKGLEQFGLFGDRTVLVEQLTVEQNLAIPITLDVDPLAPAVRARVAALGRDLHLDDATLAKLPGALSPLDLVRVRLGRALALEPRLLLAEHPTATLDSEGAEALAADMSRIVAARGMAAIYITADRAFAQQAARQVVTVKPATGELVSSVGWRRWFA